MIKIRNNNIVLLFFITLLLVLFSFNLYATYAWLTESIPLSTNLTPGTGEVIVLSKSNNNPLDLSNPNYFDSDRGILILNGVTKSKLSESELLSDNLFEDINFDVVVNSTIYCYIRVKFYIEWKLTRTYLTVQRDPLTEIIYTNDKFPFLFYEDNSEDWYCDEATGYIYYKAVISPGSITIPLIKGGKGYSISTSRNYEEKCVASIGIRAEIVQSNRYSAIWEIPNLPWEE